MQTTPINDNVPPKPKRPCPICGKEASAPNEPFCSARCKDVDLHRWLAGAYAIPGKPAEEEGDDDE